MGKFATKRYFLRFNLAPFYTLLNYPVFGVNRSKKNNGDMRYLFFTFTELIGRNTIDFAESPEKGGIRSVMTNHGDFFAAQV